MPSNLAPEIIVTVRNPDPDQCDTTSGSLESEDCGKSNKSSASNITRVAKSARLKTTSFKENMEGMDLATPLRENTATSKTKLKSKHRHNNGESKTRITRKDSKASITTAIDMVEGKPRLWVSPRKSASAVRVQVTLHRPLNWQVVSAASSSTGSIPAKIVKQSSSSSKSTVTHSHSLSQSESLLFSISPSASILSAPNKCHSRSNFLQHRKGKVQFTELPRSRLGKHIEKIENEERGNTVSESYCHCTAFSGNDQETFNNDDGDFLSGSVFPTAEVSPSSSSVILMTQNVNDGNHDKAYVQYNNSGCSNGYNNAKLIQNRRKKSRCSSTQRRAASSHDGISRGLNPLCLSSDSEDQARSSSFQRSCYQVDQHLGLRGTRRKKRNKSALSATVSTVNQANDEEAQAGDNNNIFDPGATAAPVKPISASTSSSSSFVKKKEKAGAVVNAEEVASRKNLPEKQDSQKENSIPSSRCQYHASFVLKRPAGRNQGKGIILESSQSFDSAHPCSFYLKNKPNQQDRERYYYQQQQQEEDEQFDSEKSHEWAQHHHQCCLDSVMTWFKEPSGAEDPHVNNKGSGMGANGSSHESRLKSRSQSSSALYCIGKSGNGSVIEAQSNYGNHNNYPHGHVNGLSSSIPADIWDLPCTAKSYSPISTAKQNRQNISHYYPENYHLDSHLSSGGPTTTGLPDAETITTTGSNNSQLGQLPPGLAIGANSSTTTGANIVPVGHVSSRPGKKEKGAKKSGKSNNRAKLYAASCPDVAEHTAYCGNLPVHPPSHLHHHFDFTGDPRLSGSTKLSLRSLIAVVRALQHQWRQ